MRHAVSSLLENQAIARNAGRLAEIAELRAILEPEIAALAASRVDDKGLARLRLVLNDQERALDDCGDDAAQDLRFHMALARAAKNEVLREVVAALHDCFKECRVAPLQSPERARQSIEGHRKVYEALERRDPEQSREAMRDHLRDVAARLIGKGDVG